jgi:hypothetical protein
LINFGFTSAVSTTSPNGANPAFVKGAIESDIIAQLPSVADPKTGSSTIWSGTTSLV